MCQQNRDAREKSSRLGHILMFYLEDWIPNLKHDILDSLVELCVCNSQGFQLERQLLQFNHLENEMKLVALSENLGKMSCSIGILWQSRNKTQFSWILPVKILSTHSTILSVLVLCTVPSSFLQEMKQKFCRKRTVM